MQYEYSISIDDFLAPYFIIEQSFILVKFNKGKIWYFILSSSPYNLINSCFSVSNNKLVNTKFFPSDFVDFLDFKGLSIIEAYLLVFLSLKAFCSSSNNFLNENDIP